jgi:hypothetical protein
MENKKVEKPAKKKRVSFSEFVQMANVKHLSSAEKKKKYSIYIR